MNKSNYQAAVIGLGSIAPVHIKALDDLGIQITAICDSKQDVAAALAKDRGCAYYTDYEKMLDAGGFDVLHNCLPHYLHAPVTIAALDRGIHVVCEKPMATTVADAKKMIAAAKASGAKLEIIFQNRYNTSVQAIKSALDSGTLGRVLGGFLQVTWHRSEAYYSNNDWRGRWDTEGGGVLINQSIHTFDLMNYLLGDPTAVHASVANRAHPGIEVEDVAEGVIAYGDVNVSFYATNNYPYNAPVSLGVVCENGQAALSGDIATITYKDGKQEVSQADDSIAMPYRKDYWGYSHIKQIQGFYDWLKGTPSSDALVGKDVSVDGTPDNTLRVCGEEGLRTQKLINGIYDSAKLGHRVALG